MSDTERKRERERYLRVSIRKLQSHYLTKLPNLVLLWLGSRQMGNSFPST